MSRRALHGCIAAAAVAAWGDASAAEILGVLAVAPPPGPDDGLAEITEQLRQQVAAHSPGALDAAQLRARMTEAAPDAALPALERAYETARLAYLGGEYERSVGMLRATADELERLPDGAETFALWTKTMLRLARTEVDLGRLDGARASIERVLRASPDVVVDRSLYTARLAEEVERAREALKRAPSGTLEVSSSLPGAHVHVDGRDVGVAPVRLVLPRGRYRISGATGTSKLDRIVVDVGAERREVRLDVAIAEAFRPSSGPGLALDRDGRARHLLAAGRQLGLDRVVAVAIAEERGASYVVGALYDVSRGALEREGRVRLTDGALPTAAAAALAEFLANGRVSSPLLEIPGGKSVPSLVPASPHAAPAAATLPPSLRGGRVSLGLRLGFARGLGNVASATGTDEWMRSHVPVQADVLIGVAGRLSLGGYASYGFAQAGGDVRPWCDSPGASCSLYVIRAGVQGTYAFAPGAASPWVGAGFGYEWSVLHVEGDGRSDSGNVTARGAELVNVQGGLDWAVAHGVSVGPFVMVTLGRYGRIASSSSTMTAGGEAGTAHLWSQFGIRTRFDAW